MLTLVLAVVALLLARGVVAALRGANGSDLVYGSAAALAGLGAAASFAFLMFGPQAESLTLPLGLPWVRMHLRLDPLAAWFGLIVNLAGAAAAVYGLGYGPHTDAPARVLPFFPVFLAAMNAVLVADDAFTFLVAWEFMSVASWLLVLSNHRREGNQRAAQVYLVMAVLGTACLLLAFGTMAGPDGRYAFAAMREQPPTGTLAGIGLALALVGTASKAGLVPLHAWLPIAHPAAPSHVSALMSGAMTKVALYGLARIVFDLAGPLPWGWGAVLVAAGAASALLGVLYALFERDAKTLLAYSTVENVGIVALGFGLALVFRANGLAALAALAVTAGLLHAFNHALMKSLLFFVAGAIETATGRRDLEALGGLVHRMKVTAALALAGSAAIAALPPFNGFVSEWLTFQAILNAPALEQWPLKFMVPLAGALLALSAALAASCFVRFFGIAFLGRPRSAEAAAAEEVAAPMRQAMAALAVLCLLVGVLPALAVDAMAPAIRLLAGGDLPMLAGGVAARDLIWFVPLRSDAASYGGLIVLAAVALVTLLVVRAVHRLGSDRLRRAPPWDCGFPDPSPATQYTASSFAQPLRRVFGATVFGARESIAMPPPGDARPARFALRLVDPVWRGLYAPVERAVIRLGDRLNPIQFMTIRRYLVFMFSALVVLLAAVVLAE